MASSSSSVSLAEVQKFSGMDQDWWDPQKNPLIYMNAIRVQYIRSMVETELQQPLLQQQQQSNNQKQKQSTKNNLPFTGLTALDIGCGGGLLSESLARLGANVTGVDPSANLIQAAQKHAAVFLTSSTSSSSITYLTTTAEELAVELAAKQLPRQDDDDEKVVSSPSSSLLFDVVCLLEVVEHATDVPSLLSTASSLVKPGGLLFVSTINKTRKSLALAIVGAEYIARFLPIGTHDWNQFLSPSDIAQVLESQGLVDPVGTPCGMVLTSPLPPLLGQCWKWKLDPNDTDVNWIGTYQRRQ